MFHQSGCFMTHPFKVSLALNAGAYRIESRKTPFSYWLLNVVSLNEIVPDGIEKCARANGEQRNDALGNESQNYESCTWYARNVVSVHGRLQLLTSRDVPNAETIEHKSRLHRSAYFLVFLCTSPWRVDRSRTPVLRRLGDNRGLGWRTIGRRGLKRRMQKSVRQSRKSISSSNGTVGKTSYFDRGDFWLIRFSEASGVEDFNSAFTNTPTKIWPGEVEVVILSNSKLHLLAIETTDKRFAKAIEEYQELSKIWAFYKHSCSNQDCSIYERDEDMSWK